jgi:hypothetical protein
VSTLLIVYDILDLGPDLNDAHTRILNFLPEFWRLEYNAESAVDAFYTVVASGPESST